MSASAKCPICGESLEVTTEVDLDTGGVNATIHPHDGCEPPSEVEVSRIVIRRMVGNEDDVVVIEASDDLAVLEGAGMLTMALDTWMRTDGLRIKGTK